MALLDASGNISAVQEALGVASRATRSMPKGIEYEHNPMTNKIDIRTKWGTLLYALPVDSVRAARGRLGGLENLAWSIARVVNKRLKAQPHIKAALKAKSPTSVRHR